MAALTAKEMIQCIIAIEAAAKPTVLPLGHKLPLPDE